MGFWKGVGDGRNLVLLKCVSSRKWEFTERSERWGPKLEASLEKWKSFGRQPQLAAWDPPAKLIDVISPKTDVNVKLRGGKADGLKEHTGPSGEEMFKSQPGSALSKAITCESLCLLD